MSYHNIRKRKWINDIYWHLLPYDWWLKVAVDVLTDDVKYVPIF